MFTIPRRVTFGRIPIDHTHGDEGVQSHRQLWRTFQTSDHTAIFKERSSSILSLPTIELHRTLERIIVRTTEQVEEQGCTVYKGIDE